MFEKAKSAVVTVGSGRGFVVEGVQERLAVTAAHCLPSDEDGRLLLPPSHGASYSHERTYAKLLGPLGSTPTLEVECLFVDPIADIAVLGSPDNQVRCDEATAYEELVDSVEPLAITDAKGPCWLLSLEGEWFDAIAECGTQGGPFWLSKAAEGIAAGMSGSPILSADGAAIGVVRIGTLGLRDEHGPNPRLAYNLPGWLLQASALREAPAAEVAEFMAKRRPGVIHSWDDDGDVTGHAV